MNKRLNMPAGHHESHAQIDMHDPGLRMGLGELLENQAARFADNIFVIQAETGESLTYRAFNQRVNRVAHGLRAQGVGRGDYVGIMLYSSIDFLACSYALKKIGAIEVSINSTFRGKALQRMIRLTGLRTLITKNCFRDVLAEAAPGLPALEQFILAEDTADLLDFSQAFPDHRVDDLHKVMSEDDSDCALPLNDDEIAVILFTSGTTGTSKGCEIPHRSSVRAAQSMLEAFPIDEQDCVYSPYPLFHVGAAQYDVLAALMLGARAVIREGFSLSNFWPDVVRHGATWFMALGSVQPLLWSRAPCPEEKRHRLRFIWGTPLPVDHDAFEERFNLRLVRGGGYGSTDAGSVALPLFDKTGAGKVLDRYEVAIVDEKDDPLPVGAIGELLIRPKEPAIMASSYLGMPDETLKSWRNLWFHTGDLARLDAEGDLYWVARMSERIRVKGEMVSAYEIEEVILAHPSVEDCAVLGAPDGMGEEVVHPFITPCPGATLALEELVEYCTPKMSRYMLPRAMTLLAEMPRTPSGKPAKAELSRMLKDGSLLSDR